MATIGARGAASVYAMGGGNDADSGFNRDTPAGWHLGWWGLSVLIIAFFLWAL